jgi:hypothetical protein
MSETEPKSLADRLNDPDEIFCQKEVFQAFETLCDRYGYHRDPKLPAPEKMESVIASMTLDGFEHLGVLLVRSLTQRDQMIAIPSLIDKELGDNLAPGNAAYSAASALAYARCAIVSPVNLVEEMLDTDDPINSNFFYAFNRQHAAWQTEQTKAENAKKSGPATKASGSESASSSAIAATSSPQIEIG